MKCFEEHVWMVTELLSFKFWISHHFVTILTNKGKIQDALSPQPIEVFHKLFFSLIFVLSRSFIENHLFFNYQLKVICCCQSCDIILPPKTLHFRLLNDGNVNNFMFYNPAKFQLKSSLPIPMARTFLLLLMLLFVCLLFFN